MALVQTPDEHDKPHPDETFWMSPDSSLNPGQVRGFRRRAAIDADLPLNWEEQQRG